MDTSVNFEIISGENKNQNKVAYFHSETERNILILFAVKKFRQDEVEIDKN